MTITPTHRRLIVTVVTGLVIALNSKLGLGLSDGVVQALAVLATAYLIQSAGRQVLTKDG